MTWAPSGFSSGSAGEFASCSASSRGGQLRMAALIISLAALFTALSIPAASAHDVLVGSDPADGAGVSTSPKQVTLTFNDPPLDVDPQANVLDAAGKVLLKASPTVSGNTVVIPITMKLGAGSYTVAWRVVSGDGHPVQGAQRFTITGAQSAPGSSAPGSDSSPAVTDSSAGPAASAGASQTAPAGSISVRATQAESAASNAAEPGGSAPTGLIVALVALGAVIVFAGGGVFLAVRRRPSSSHSQTDSKDPS